ncbi:sel1 repeat family protein [Sphingobium sp. BYY-5]|uniref:tetratricopeptide repeat protein n=1 Tax=Sphingobium sp. BYY-5 TaxID=2926400 RepID=UPI001FA7D9CE|nr:tetratricopeptide repeat protein [Sphingobium sp. BYY-5]MCI4590404.1 sel1 repeat family protein [Sphingobium sp. BYY-5]
MTVSGAPSGYEKALALSRSEEPKLREAYELLTKACAEGDMRADYALASWHLYGNDVVERDERKGVSILKSLEKSNIAEALFDLAVSYDYGKSVRRNRKRAFSLYMKSALLGDKSACDQVSQFYAEGKFVPYDKGLAQAWEARAQQSEESISPPYRLWIDR